MGSGCAGKGVDRDTLEEWLVGGVGEYPENDLGDIGFELSGDERGIAEGLEVDVVHREGHG